MNLRIEVLPDALQQIEQAAAWWHEHRTAAAGLFRAELEAAFRQLERMPDAGRPFPRRLFPHLRVLLMPRTRYHVYYEHDAAGEVVLVRAVWSAVRSRRPPLRRGR